MPIAVLCLLQPDHLANQAEDLDPVFGQIATHYERGGMIEQALSYYQQAARVAQQLYANEEAIALLLRDLKLLEHLPAGLKHDKQELRLLLALAPLYRVTKGWAAPELEGVLDRVMALCDTVGDDEQRAEALYGLQSLYVVQARLDQVQGVSAESAVQPGTCLSLPGVVAAVARR